jgi:hypothetical protein
MVDEDDINTESGEGGEKDHGPEYASFHKIPECLFFMRYWRITYLSIFVLSVIHLMGDFSRISVGDEIYLLGFMSSEKEIEREGLQE